MLRPPLAALRSARSAGLLVLLLGACGLSGGEDALVLELDGPALEVAIDPRNDPWPLFRVEVGESATGLHLSTEGATHDVELYARYETPPDVEGERWDVASASPWIDEDLWLEVSDLLVSGTWYVAVVLSPAAVFEVGEPELRFALRAESLHPARAPLKLNQLTAAALHRENGLRIAFEVELPPGAAGSDDELRLEVFSPAADVEVLAAPSAGGDAWTDAYASSLSTWPFERLRLPLRDVDGELFVHVYAYAAYESVDLVPVTVLAATREREDLTVAPEPLVPATSAQDATDRAIAATVTLVGPLGGGSGVVVSEDGLLVTNAHVVVGAEVEGEREGSSPRPGRRRELPALAAGFTLDPARAPVPSVGLEVLDVRDDLDLALLRIRSRLDGTPLPAGLRFPYLSPAAGRLPLGTEVAVLGYPMTGGSGSMISVTLTRGVISGYSAEPEGLVYKTDAAVHSGVSGGACIDRAGRLIGLPSASIADVNEAGGLGFVIPVDRLPREWLELLKH